MPPLSASDQQKLLLQQEIAKLSGAISRHANNIRPAFQPYPQNKPSNHYHQAPSRGRGKPRGGTSGRGGGRSFALDLRAANKASTRKEVAEQGGAGSSKVVVEDQKEAGEISPSPPPQPQPPAAESSKTEEAWIRSRGGMSIMTKERSDVLQSRPRRPRKRLRPPAQIQDLGSSSSKEGQKVVIDGVVFQFEPGGQKLTRIGPVDGVPSSPVETTPTRKRVSYAGSRYKRTTRGNLVKSRSKAELATIPCRYFTKTGRCNRALTCPYAHDPARLAICPKFLRDTCPHIATSCPVSHTPSAHNTPSCVHFQATSTCRNGASCKYPHIKVSSDAPVCEAFARDGWCDKEAGTCPELHIWECPEWRAKGTCARGAKCELKHVIRAESGREKLQPEGAQIVRDVSAAQEGQRMPIQGGFDDGGEFIVLDQGSPPIVISDDEESGSIDEDEVGSDMRDEEGNDSGSSDDSDEMDDDEETSEDEEAQDASHTLPVEGLKGKGRVGEHTSPPPSDPMDTDEAEEEEVLGVVG